MNKYCKYGDMLFKTVENEDFYICPKFSQKWEIVDDFAYENGIYPRAYFDKISEEEALQFALNLGMPEEAFYE